MKKFIAIILALCFVLSFAACSQSGSGEVTVADIQKRGVLKVGVKDSLVGMGYYNTQTGEWEGVEVDIARKIADEIGVDVEFTAVTPTSRFQVIESGDVDVCLATGTITEERKKSYFFTTPYYVDTVGLMVLKDSGINSVEDLYGKHIGVTVGSTNIAALSEYAPEGNFVFDEFDDHAAIKLALSSGAVAAHCVDVTVMTTYMDETTMILPDRFAPQQYGAFSNLKNKEFNAYIDSLIGKWIEDGTIAAIVEANGVAPAYQG